jgi:hypothetical protein
MIKNNKSYTISQTFSYIKISTHILNEVGNPLILALQESLKVLV